MLNWLLVNQNISFNILIIAKAHKRKQGLTIFYLSTYTIITTNPKISNCNAIKNGIAPYGQSTNHRSVSKGAFTRNKSAKYYSLFGWTEGINCYVFIPKRALTLKRITCVLRFFWSGWTRPKANYNIWNITKKHKT